MNQSIHKSYSPTELNKIKKLVTAIRKTILKKYDYIQITDITDKLLISCILKYDISRINKKVLSYIVDDVRTQINKDNNWSTFLPDSLFKKDIVKKEYFISIDSSDRNIAKWVHCNEYSIDLGGIHARSMNNQHSTSGAIQSSFTNIESIELISAIVPKYSDTGDQISNYPYLLLDIDEIPGIYKGTNMHTSNAFAKLRFQNDLGHFKEYTYNNGERFIQHFNPIISLHRMTIRFRCPDGSLYNFGQFITSHNPQHEYCPPNSTNSAPMDDVCNPDDIDIDAGDVPSVFVSNTQESTTQIPTNNSLVFRVVCVEPIIQTLMLQRT